MQLSEEVHGRLAAIVESGGLDLVAVEFVGQGPRTILRLVVDSADGINLDQCAEVSREASALLDVEDPIRHQYTLEVTSPGLDRKLYSPADYERFAGQQVNIRMQPSYRQHRVVTGELLGVEQEEIRVRCDSQDVVTLPMAQVFEARIEVDWKQILKEGKSRP